MRRAFARNLGEGSVTRAVLAGLVHGLHIAWKIGIRQLVVETDSKTAIQLLTSAGIRHPHSGHDLSPDDHDITTPCPMLSYWLYYDSVGFSLTHLIDVND
ncbi:unnamed protein product [Linum trigynum]|uniref:RNase H type-1 domain-containing protein n=1 Tax=Linum trigynum TaxID=586398 RepID=A0AAV2DH22_9ROSI